MNWLREMLSARSGMMSSKRVCGTLGFLVSMGVLIYCAINSKEAPQMIETFIISCMGLLGVDSITGIWKRE